MSESETIETTETEEVEEAEETFEDRFLELTGSEPITMYKLASVLSSLTGRYVREQQMYNYRTKNMIKGEFEDGKVWPETVVAWAEKFVAKRV